MAESKKKIVKCDTNDPLPYVKNRIVTTPAHYAYLKIAEGCKVYCKAQNGQLIL